MSAAAPPRVTPVEGLRAIVAGMSPRRRRQMWLSFALMIVGGVAEMISIGAVLPFLALLADPQGAARIPAVAMLLDWSGATTSAELLLPAVGLLIAAAIFTASIRLLLAWFSQKFVLELGHDIGVEIYARMLRQPYSLYVQRNTSELISGVEKVQIVVFAVLLPAMQALVAAFLAVFIVAMLIFIDPANALLAAAAMGAVYIGVSFATRRILRRNAHTLAVNQTERIKLIQEGLGGIRDILIDQSQAVFQESFRKLDYGYRRAQTVNVFVAAAPRFIVEASGIVLIALLALFMSARAGGLIAAIPVIGALALGAQRLLPLLQLVYSGWSQFVGAGQVLIDVMVLLRAPVTRDRPREKSAAVLPYQEEIRIRNVSFRYQGSDEPALHNIDLVVRRGERIGFLGQTGSGKSTLIDLLMGLLEPSEGEISIDGRPLDEATRAQWQGQIAHVPQTIYLSDSTIASNIAFGEEPATIDIKRVREAAKRAQIDSFIVSLPEGYDTEVGERGVRLSGGQRQRIGIARALYKNAGVLIFDEATSALDDETEAAVMGALSSVGRDLTIFMIAHRLSTLAGCDRLVRLEQGRIAAVGAFAELVGTSADAPILSNGI